MMRNYKYLKVSVVFLVIATLLGPVLSNFTADFLSKPAENLMNFIAGSGFSSSNIEKDGIPLVFYPRLRKAEYYPLYIASRALSDFKTADAHSNEKSLSLFLLRIKWLKEHLTIRTYHGITYGIWENNFPFSYYKMNPPWRSGMGQGYGMSALLKAYDVTRDASYLEFAKYALNAFSVNVDNGGVTYKDSDDEWWFEEYAGSKIQSRVLNGAIYALLDVYNFWRTTGDKDAENVFRKGLNGIRKRLNTYDAGSWTYYDAIGTIATEHYHQDHIKLTRQLYAITGEKLFLDWSIKWSRYRLPYFKREFLIQKPDYHDIVILFLNIGIVLVAECIIGIFFLIRRSRRQ
jgi:heparosan-N-sulfate-glucuronate 5-epimerase